LGEGTQNKSILLSNLLLVNLKHNKSSNYIKGSSTSGVAMVGTADAKGGNKMFFRSN
jgi:hypothetical protein